MVGSWCSANFRLFVALVSFFRSSTSYTFSPSFFSDPDFYCRNLVNGVYCKSPCVPYGQQPRVGLYRMGEKLLRLEWNLDEMNGLNSDDARIKYKIYTFCTHSLFNSYKIGKVNKRTDVLLTRCLCIRHDPFWCQWSETLFTLSRSRIFIPLTRRRRRRGAPPRPAVG